MIRNVVQNTSALLSIQVANLIIPLITLPYLARVLGVESFGELGFALVVIHLLIIFVNFGFDLSVTASLAVCSTNQKAINQIFFSTIAAKSFLCLIALVLIFLLMILLPAIYEIRLILISGFGMVFGSVIFPAWLFQGLQKMGSMAKSNFIARILSIPMIFILVQNKNHTYIVMIIYSLTSILAGVLAFYYIFKLKLVSGIYRPKFIDIKSVIHDSYHYFLSHAAVSLYTISNMFVVGILLSPSSVGYYAGLDKIKSAMLALTSSFTQAIYPKVNILIKSDQEKAYTFLSYCLIVFFIIGLLYSVFIHFSAPFIIDLVLGDEYQEATFGLKIMAILPVLVILNTFYSTQIMLPLGLKDEFLKITCIGGMCNLTFIYLLIEKLDYIGVCISMVLTECIVLIVILKIVIKKHNNFHLTLLGILCKK